MVLNNEKTSKFSSGLNIIMRLDELWKDTHKHSREGSYKLWNTDLDRMWLELARDLDEETFKEKVKEFLEFEEEILKTGDFIDKKPIGFKNIDNSTIKNRNKQYKVLMSKQTFIARLENELGKGTTFDEGDDDDFD